MSFNPDRPTTPDQPTRNSVAFHDANRALARAEAQDEAARIYGATLVRQRSLVTVFASAATVTAAAPAPLVVMGHNRVIADSPIAGGAHG